MLRRYDIARFALQHSPEKEQRLLAYQVVASSSQSDDQENDVLQTRSELFAAQNEQEHRRFLVTHRNDLEAVLHPETDLETMSAEEIGSVMDAVRQAVATEVAEEQELGKKIALIDPQTENEEVLTQLFVSYGKVLERYNIVGADVREVGTKLQALFNNDVQEANRNFERQYAENRNKGAKWSFMNENDFLEKYGNATGRAPSAFTQNGVIYFNVEHPDFKDPTTRDANMKRVVAHEMMHVTLAEDAATEQELLQTFSAMPAWSELTKEVTSLIGEDELFIMGKVNGVDRVILQEALAIYAGRSAGAMPTNSPEAKLLAVKEEAIAKRVANMLGSIADNKTKKRVDALLEKSQRYTHMQKWNAETQEVETVELSRMLQESVDSIAVQDKLLKGEEEFTSTYRFNNTPVAEDLEKQLKAKEELQRKQNEELDTLIGTIGSTISTITDIRGNDEVMRAFVNKTVTDGTERTEQLAALDQINEELGLYGNDLTMMKKHAEALKNWGSLSVEEKNQVASMFPTNPYANLGQSPSEAEIQAADDACANDRKQVQSAISDTVTGITERVNMQKEAFEKAQKMNDTIKNEGGVQSESMWGWIKKNIVQVGTSGSIMWVSPLNIMRIFTIYKEAIVENYKSNQSLKEYNLAKKLNFYKPIEHTLKKQAKAANEKETGEFKEYIEREGYTFDEIFGPDGKGTTSGLLHQNRHNFNRAKAVILYAADHAWLYHMNRLDGSNVYGIDYEGIEGTKSFEELVEQYEGGKKKEEDKGYQKVNKHPDIPPMIADMRDELKKKNIFAVKGMLKRIQEKAKLGESNAWAAAEIVRAMRDPAVMAVMDKGFLDDVGNIGIGQSAWTLTLFKLMRHDFEKYRTGQLFKGKKRELGTNNVFVSAVDRIQELLKEAGVKESNTDLDEGMDRYIGKVLAGQTVQIGGKTISIFQNDPDFNAYREFWATTPTSTEPGKTDDDYFNPANNGSDLLMLPKTSIQAILVRTSLGHWTHGTKAPNFLAQVMLRDSDLKKNDPTAQAIFRKEMRERLSYFFGEAVSHTATRENFGDDITPTNGGMPHISDRNILLELWQRSLISDQHFKTLTFGLKDDGLVPKALREMRKAKTELDQLKADKADEGAIAAAKAKLALEIEKARTADTRPSAAA